MLSYFMNVKAAYVTYVIHDYVLIVCRCENLQKQGKRDETSLDFGFQGKQKFFIHTYPQRIFSHYLLPKEGLKCNKSISEPTLSATGRHILPISCLPCYSVDPYQNHIGMKSIWNPDLTAYKKREKAQRGKVKTLCQT